jgi:metal-responsive CopG/Arc/MetJ family transcriptional regulator
MPEKPEVTLTVRLPEQLSNSLNRAARDLDQTRGELIRRALTAYLSAYGAEPKVKAETGQEPNHVIQ